MWIVLTFDIHKWQLFHPVHVAIDKDHKFLFWVNVNCQSSILLLPSNFMKLFTLTHRGINNCSNQKLKFWKDSRLVYQNFNARRICVTLSSFVPKIAPFNALIRRELLVTRTFRFCLFVRHEFSWKNGKSPRQISTQRLNRSFRRILHKILASL